MAAVVMHKFHSAPSFRASALALIARRQVFMPPSVYATESLYESLAAKSLGDHFAFMTVNMTGASRGRAGSTNRVPRFVLAEDPTHVECVCGLDCALEGLATRLDML